MTEDVERISGELAKSLAKPEPLPPLYTLLENVQELIEAREDAIAEGAPPAELEGFDKAIGEILSAEVVGKKADAIAGTLAQWQDLAEAAKKAEERATAHRRHWEARVALLKERTLYAMQAHGVKRIETATNTLRLCGNGGTEPLQADVSILLNHEREDLLLVSVKLPLSEWNAMWKFYGEHPHIVGTAVVSENQQRIRAALAKTEPCEQCHATGNEQVPMDSFHPNGTRKCPRCEGRGTVQSTVPGAKLLPRGEHLRVE